MGSSVRNAARRAITSKTYTVKNTYYFASSLLYANGQNSGLLSIGNPLTLTSATPAICTVASVVSQDNTGGIFSLATINTLTAGSCNVVWQFAGASGRAATSKIMTFAVK